MPILVQLERSTMQRRQASQVIHMQKLGRSKFANGISCLSDSIFMQAETARNWTMATLKVLLDVKEEAETGGPPRAQAVNSAYVSPIQRALGAVEKYSSDVRRTAKLESVVSVLSIRAPNLAKSTANLELCAMRQFCGRMLERRRLARDRGEYVLPRQVVPKNLDVPDWIVETTWAEIEKLSADLKRSNVANLFNDGLRLANEAMVREKLRSGLGANPGIVFELGNIKNAWPVADVKRKPKRSWENIGRRELEILLESLPSRSENFGVDSLGDRRCDKNGIAKLLAWSTWLTGMRAIEVFRCRIVVAPSSADGRAANKDILSDPIDAFRRKRLVELDEFATFASRDLRNRILEESARTGVPPMLLIETAKTVCSSPGIDNRLRILILEGISANDFAVLCLASQLRQLKLDPKRFAHIRDGCSKKIKSASLRTFPDRLDPITLHYFRHAFADSARRLLTPPQVAALMGHTSRETARGYGGKFVRRSKYAKRARWLPQHDPNQAELLEAAWTEKPANRRDVVEPNTMPPIP